MKSIASVATFKAQPSFGRHWLEMLIFLLFVRDESCSEDSSPRGTPLVFCHLFTQSRLAEHTFCFQQCPCKTSISMTKWYHKWYQVI